MDFFFMVIVLNSIRLQKNGKMAHGVAIYHPHIVDQLRRVATCNHVILKLNLVANGLSMIDYMSNTSQIQI